MGLQKSSEKMRFTQNTGGKIRFTEFSWNNGIYICRKNKINFQNIKRWEMRFTFYSRDAGENMFYKILEAN